MSEASGLTRGLRNPEALWTLNDSGNAERLYAFDSSGRDLATVQVEASTNVDWEDLAVGPGPGGQPALYVADTGDNNRVRREVRIYRVAEPALPSRPSSGAIRARAERLSLTYADGRVDVEALLVHPMTGEMVLVGKDYGGQAPVYSLPGLFEAGAQVVARRVTTLDLSGFGPLVAAVTGGAVSPDGRQVVIRTYGAGLEYDLAPGAPLAEFWRRPPRAFAIADGSQGEGITYRADGGALLTIGEGSPASLYRLERQC